MREPSKCADAIDMGGVYVCRPMCLPCQVVKTEWCGMEEYNNGYYIPNREKDETRGSGSDLSEMP